ncbi:hypothetical protein HK096_004341 [Nowakowskiella sp. JEL0078]|nr:hypothetical protein HK096_004341 [Nowakowskiella sp. JEL0078]
MLLSGYNTPPSSPRNLNGNRLNSSSIILGDDHSPFNSAKPANPDAFVNKLRNAIPNSPAGLPSNSQPLSRRHTYLGGGNMAAILGGESAESKPLPPRPSPKLSTLPFPTQVVSPVVQKSEPAPKVQAPRYSNEAPASTRHSEDSIHRSQLFTLNANASLPDLTGTSKISKRHSFGIVPVNDSSETRRQTRRLMPEHQNGFKPSSNIFSSEGFDELKPSRLGTPPALRSSIIFGSDANLTSPPSPSLRSATPTNRSNESHVVLGDDGGVPVQTVRKKNSYRRMITPPGFSKNQSFADFIGAPKGEVSSPAPQSRTRADPATVSAVAGKDKTGLIFVTQGIIAGFCVHHEDGMNNALNSSASPQSNLRYRNIRSLEKTQATTTALSLRFAPPVNSTLVQLDRSEFSHSPTLSTSDSSAIQQHPSRSELPVHNNFIFKQSSLSEDTDVTPSGQPVCFKPMSVVRVFNSLKTYGRKVFRKTRRRRSEFKNEDWEDWNNAEISQAQTENFLWTGNSRLVTKSIDGETVTVLPDGHRLVQPKHTLNKKDSLDLDITVSSDSEIIITPELKDKQEKQPMSSVIPPSRTSSWLPKHVPPEVVLAAISRQSYLHGPTNSVTKKSQKLLDVIEFGAIEEDNDENYETEEDEDMAREKKQRSVRTLMFEDIPTFGRHQQFRPWTVKPTPEQYLNLIRNPENSTSESMLQNVSSDYQNSDVMKLNVSQRNVFISQTRNNSVKSYSTNLTSQSILAHPAGVFRGSRARRQTGSNASNRELSNTSDILQYPTTEPVDVSTEPVDASLSRTNTSSVLIHSLEHTPEISKRSILATSQSSSTQASIDIPSDFQDLHQWLEGQIRAAVTKSGRRSRTYSGVSFASNGTTKLRSSKNSRSSVIRHSMESTVDSIKWFNSLCDENPNHTEEDRHQRLIKIQEAINKAASQAIASATAQFMALNSGGENQSTADFLEWYISGLQNYTNQIRMKQHRNNLRKGSVSPKMRKRSSTISSTGRWRKIKVPTSTQNQRQTISPQAENTSRLTIIKGDLRNSSESWHQKFIESHQAPSAVASNIATRGDASSEQVRNFDEFGASDALESNSDFEPASIVHETVKSMKSMNTILSSVASLDFSLNTDARFGLDRRMTSGSTTTSSTTINYELWTPKITEQKKRTKGKRRKVNAVFPFREDYRRKVDGSRVLENGDNASMWAPSDSDPAYDLLQEELLQDRYFGTSLYQHPEATRNGVASTYQIAQQSGKSDFKIFNQSSNQPQNPEKYQQPLKEPNLNNLMSFGGSFGTSFWTDERLTQTTQAQNRTKPLISDITGTQELRLDLISPTSSESQFLPDIVSSSDNLQRVFHTPSGSVLDDLGLFDLKEDDEDSEFDFDADLTELKNGFPDKLDKEFALSVHVSNSNADVLENKMPANIQLEACGSNFKGSPLPDVFSMDSSTLNQSAETDLNLDDSENTPSISIGKDYYDSPEWAAAEALSGKPINMEDALKKVEAAAAVMRSHSVKLSALPLAVSPKALSSSYTTHSSFSRTSPKNGNNLKPRVSFTTDTAIHRSSPVSKAKTTSTVLRSSQVNQNKNPINQHAKLVGLEMMAVNAMIGAGLVGDDRASRDGLLMAGGVALQTLETSISERKLNNSHNSSNRKDDFRPRTTNLEVASQSSGSAESSKKSKRHVVQEENTEYTALEFFGPNVHYGDEFKGASSSTRTFQVSGSFDSKLEMSPDDKIILIEVIL